MNRNYAWSLYGATGITGRLILETALKRGHRPRLLGRPSDELRNLAAEAGLTCGEIALEDGPALEAILKETSLVLHAAGPYGTTGGPMLAAALKARTHYVDINGEPAFLEMLLAQDQPATQAGIALVGCAGFGVAAAEGLALLVVRRLPGASWIRVGVASDNAYASTAAGATKLAVIAGGGRRIINGKPVRRPLADVTWTEQDPRGEAVHFGAAPMAELVAILKTTAVANVTVGVPMKPLQARIIRLVAPFLPTLLRLRGNRSVSRIPGDHERPRPLKPYCSRVWATAGNESGIQHTAFMEAGEGYEFAAMASVRAVESILAGVTPGAYTPGRAFGESFLESIPSVKVIDFSTSVRKNTTGN